MKLEFKPLVIALSLLGIISAPAWADSPEVTAAAPDQAKVLADVTKREAALETEVNSLKSEIRELKAAQAKTPSNHATVARHATLTQTSSSNAQTNNYNSVAQSTAQAGQQTSEPQHHYMPFTNQGPTVPGLGTKQEVFPVYLLGQAPLLLGGTPVIISPYLGQRTAFDASDLLVNVLDANIDREILQERQKIENAYTKAGEPIPQNSLVDLSGAVEGQVFTNGPYAGSRSSDIDLTKARIDILAEVNKWSTGFLSIDYDNTPTTFGPRESNSRLFLNKGFITIGSLNNLAYYGTIGQYFLPFGEYLSYLLSSPFTQMLGQTKARAITLGFDRPFGGTGNTQAFAGSIFGFRGISGPGPNSPNRINGVGADLDYLLTPDPWNVDLGVSYINNIAGSNGMQNVGALNGATVGFPGFGQAPGGESLSHQVPGVSVHTMVGYGAYSVIAEYISATKEFAYSNLFFNSHGAKPEAFHIELVRTFSIFDRPSNVVVGYDASRQALALLIPQQRYIAGFNISIWKDTIESLEYRHDINYAASNIAGGQGFSANAGSGHTSDTATAQIGVYF